MVIMLSYHLGLQLDKGNGDHSGYDTKQAGFPDLLLLSPLCSECHYMQTDIKSI